MKIKKNPGKTEITQNKHNTYNHNIHYKMKGNLT